ncbi:MAG: hypothetical protein HOH70_05055 [Halieaceae bacterium]|nr:hypothetical protein [Halieaceae bacterium]
MTAQIAISGRLGNDPKPHGSEEKPMTTCFLFGEVEVRDESDISFPVNLVAFGQVAKLLARLDKGSFLTVSGKLQGSTYQGEVRYSVLVNDIVSAKASQPRGGKAKTWEQQKESADRLYGKK